MREPFGEPTQALERKQTKVSRRPRSTPCWGVVENGKETLPQVHNGRPWTTKNTNHLQCHLAWLRS